MTLDEIQTRVDAIRLAAEDDEVAHSMEDELHQDILRIVAEHDGPWQTWAVEALKTLEIDFSRWLP